MNSIKNVCNRFKYGKVVYKSKTGDITIRRKLNYPRLFDTRTGHVSTTKTIMDRSGNINHQIERNAYIDKEVKSSTVRDVLYDQKTGLPKPQTEQPRTVTYLDKKDEQIITDNRKPGYDYVYTPLPNGKTKYVIAYPEQTIINKKENTIITTMHTKEEIV